MPGGDTVRVRIESKAFGGRQVLGHIQFNVGPGEVVALLAPSGMGKTTVLRVVLGLDRLFQGSVERSPGPIGTVFQEPRLLPWMNVGSNIRLVAPHLVARDVDELLSRVSLPEAARLMPKQLSLGMARRVAIARALAVRPSLLVMDEPLASLDPMLATSISREINATVRELNTTVLFATHDIRQAIDTASRILILGGPAPAVLAVDMPAHGVKIDDLVQRFSFLLPNGAGQD